LIAGLMIIQVLSEAGGTLSELAAEYRGRYEVIPESNFQVDDKQAKISELKQVFSDGEIDELDGLTISFTDGWINVRPSNTEPLLRLNAEARTKQRLDEIVTTAEEILSS